MLVEKCYEGRSCVGMIDIKMHDTWQRSWKKPWYIPLKIFASSTMSIWWLRYLKGQRFLYSVSTLKTRSPTLGEVGHFSVIFRFYPMSERWNPGIAWKLPIHTIGNGSGHPIHMQCHSAMLSLLTTAINLWCDGWQHHRCCIIMAWNAPCSLQMLHFWRRLKSGMNTEACKYSMMLCALPGDEWHVAAMLNIKQLLVWSMGIETNEYRQYELKSMCRVLVNVLSYNPRKYNTTIWR